MVGKPCSLAKLEKGPSLNTPRTYHWKALNWSEAWPPGPDGWASIQSSLLTSCVTLGKLLKISVPYFLYLYNGPNDAYLMRLIRLNELIYTLSIWHRGGCTENTQDLLPGTAHDVATISCALSFFLSHPFVCSPLSHVASFFKPQWECPLVTQWEQRATLGPLHILLLRIRVSRLVRLVILPCPVDDINSWRSGSLLCLSFIRPDPDSGKHSINHVGWFRPGCIRNKTSRWKKSKLLPFFSDLI